jgi:hypothetical protein
VFDPATKRVALCPPLTHKGFVSTLFADSPFRANLLYTVAGFVGYVACAFCKIRGVRKGPGERGTMRYTGYAEPVLCTSGGVEQQFQLGHNDEQRLHSSSDLKHLAATAELARQAGVDASATGFTGQSPLLSYLPWLDVRTASVVPFMHAYCQGVVKGFLKALFVSPKKAQPSAPAGMAGSSMQRAAAAAAGSKRQRQQQQPAAAGEGGGPQAQQQQQHQDAAAAAMSPAQRVTYDWRSHIARRAGSFKGGLHPQHSRPVRNVAKYHASLTFEEVANLIRGWTAHLFGQLLSPTGQVKGQLLTNPAVKQAWGHQRRFGHFHLTQQQWASEAEYKAAVLAALQEFLAYCTLCEQASVAAREAVVQSLHARRVVWVQTSGVTGRVVSGVTGRVEQPVSSPNTHTHTLFDGSANCCVNCTQDFEPGKPTKHSNSSLCTYNLHLLACQLSNQCLYRGHTTEWLED